MPVKANVPLRRNQSKTFPYSRGSIIEVEMINNVKEIIH